MMTTKTASPAPRILFTGLAMSGVGLSTGASAGEGPSPSPSVRIVENGLSLTGSSYDDAQLWGGSTVYTASGSKFDSSSLYYQDPYAGSTSLYGYEGATSGLSPNGSSLLDNETSLLSFDRYDFRNAIIEARLADGRPLQVRIDDVAWTGFLQMVFRLSAAVSGQPFRPICADGAYAYIVPGRWSLETGGRVDDGESPGLSFACVGSSVAKCVEMGYQPWSFLGGERDLHAACVRMLRADYCGDGRSFTVDGTPIAWSDGAGIHSDGSSTSLEATWGPQGANCIERARHPALVEQVACVDALRRSSCDADAALLSSGVIETEAEATRGQDQDTDSVDGANVVDASLEPAEVESGTDSRDDGPGSHRKGKGKQKGKGKGKQKGKS